MLAPEIIYLTAWVGVQQDRWRRVARARAARAGRRSDLGMLSVEAVVLIAGFVLIAVGILAVVTARANREKSKIRGE